MHFKGGWTRVGYLNMTESGATCPTGLTQQQYNKIDHKLCGRPNPSSAGCSSTTFSTLGLSYYKVCGQVRGYEFNTPDGLQRFYNDLTISSPYVMVYPSHMVKVLVNTFGLMQLIMLFVVPVLRVLTHHFLLLWGTITTVKQVLTSFGMERIVQVLKLSVVRIQNNLGSIENLMI